METLKGQETFNAPPEQVFAELTDLSKLSKHLPSLDSSQIVDEKTLRAVVKPGFSFVRGTLKLTITLVEGTPHTQAKHRIAASGIGLGMDIDTVLDLSPAEKGTRLDWQINILKRSGLLALVGSGLIQGAAEKTVKEGWDSLRKQVES